MRQYIEEDFFRRATQRGITIEIVIAARIEMWNDDFEGNDAPADAREEEEDAKAWLFIFPDHQQTEQGNSERNIFFAGSSQQTGQQEPARTSVAQREHSIE